MGIRDFSSLFFLLFFTLSFTCSPTRWFILVISFVGLLIYSFFISILAFLYSVHAFGVVVSLDFISVVLTRLLMSASLVLFSHFVVPCFPRSILIFLKYIFALLSFIFYLLLLFALLPTKVKTQIWSEGFHWTWRQKFKCNLQSGVWSKLVTEPNGEDLTIDLP